MCQTRARRTCWCSHLHAIVDISESCRCTHCSRCGRSINSSDRDLCAGAHSGQASQSRTCSLPCSRPRSCSAWMVTAEVRDKTGGKCGNSKRRCKTSAGQQWQPCRCSFSEGNHCIRLPLGASSWWRKICMPYMSLCRHQQ